MRAVGAQRASWVVVRVVVGEVALVVGPQVPGVVARAVAIA